MFKFNSKALAVALAAVGLVSATGSAVAASTQGNLAMRADLVSGCEVQAGAINFGNITTLASAGDKTADSGVTFKVACSSDVIPTIATLTARSMSDGTATPHLLPFNLSLAAAGADDLGSATPSALTITKDGTLQTVTLYAKVLNTNFTGANALPAGTYLKTMVMDVAY